jgi:WD40 repeat protein
VDPTAGAFSSDGGLFATAAMGKIKLWNAKNGPWCHCFLRSHSGTVNAMAFSPGGFVIATASNDATIVLCDVQTMTLRKSSGTLPEHPEGTGAVAFSPDCHSLTFGVVGQ